MEHGETFISAIKSTEIKPSGGKSVWRNKLYMCEGAVADGLQALRWEKKWRAITWYHSGYRLCSCKDYDPWGGSYKECILDKRVRGGKLDMTGLGDVKVRLLEWEFRSRPP